VHHVACNLEFESAVLPQRPGQTLLEERWINAVISRFYYSGEEEIKHGFKERVEVVWVGSDSLVDLARLASSSDDHSKALVLESIRSGHLGGKILPR